MCLGIPGQIVEITDAANQLAAVMVSGARRTVNIGLLPGDAVAPGSWVLVHAGFALDAIDEHEARATLALLQEMSDAFAGGPSRVNEPSAVGNGGEH
ncbi:MAG TPA: HypC/HybG/HupF family hydrogenase formation chaperone [Ktedonobacterales bacterium]|jgi:hydrogenase expression/formation protein HypC|nr:HypC/HybG/HupF family hydrogenase formation chaperone [Ktedonobacterales bacterium]